MKTFLILLFLLPVSQVFAQAVWYNSNTFEEDVKDLFQQDLISEALYIRLLDSEFRNREYLQFGKTSIYQMIDQLPKSSEYYTSTSGMRDGFGHNVAMHTHGGSLNFKFELYDVYSASKIKKIEFAIMVRHFNTDYALAFKKEVLNPEANVEYIHTITNEELFTHLDEKISTFYKEKIGTDRVVNYAKFKIRYVTVEFEDGTVIEHDDY